MDRQSANILFKQTGILPQFKQGKNMLQANQKVFLDAKCLSAGTYCSIMKQSEKFSNVNCSEYDNQEKVNYAFTNFICLSEKAFNTWQDAWYKFVETL